MIQQARTLKNILEWIEVVEANGSQLERPLDQFESVLSPVLLIVHDGPGPSEFFNFLYFLTFGFYCTASIANISGNMIVLCFGIGPSH